VEPGVPSSLRTAAAIAWRVLILAAVVFLLGLAVARLRLVVLPVFGALLAATFLAPPVSWLRGRGVPAGLASFAAIVGAIAVVGGISAALAPSVAGELEELDVSVTGGVDEVEEWLIEGPLSLSRQNVNDLFDRAEQELRDSSDVIASGALSGAAIALEAIAAALLGLVILFFLLKDGPRIWTFLIELFPVRIRDDVRGMGDRAWTTLGGFLRGTAIVAAIDAFFIGLTLALVGVPLVIPLAVITFFGGFVPIVGAFVAGFASAMVALVSNGLTAALIVVGATLAVQQIEGNLLQPLIVGRRVELHPIVVLLAVTTGGVLWGVLGAFVAVPVASAAWAALSYLREKRLAVELPPGTRAVPPAAPEGGVSEPVERAERP
jgi:predicted PurR-regulated permease PerM